MTKSIEIPQAERHVYRVFHIRRDPKAVKALIDGEAEEGIEAAAMLLGSNELETEYVELIDLEDLKEIGLSGYLIEGYGLPNEDVMADATKLDALEGYVLLLLPEILGHRGGVLNPNPDVVLVATYKGEGTDWTEKEPIESESAAPFTAPPETVKKKLSDAAMSGRIAMLALIVIFLLTALVVWIA